jgi:hypothetical protein
MEKNTIAILEMIAVVVVNTRGCMLSTRLAFTMCGDPKWKTVVLPGIKTRNPTRHHLILQMIKNQKLILKDKLRNAFCTQAGLSAEAVDRIWEDAQRNE